MITIIVQLFQRLFVPNDTALLQFILLKLIQQ